MSSQSNKQHSNWLSVAQAATYLGCSRGFLDKDRVQKIHGIPFSRMGRHIRYHTNDLDAFLESHKEPICAQ